MKKSEITLESLESIGYKGYKHVSNFSGTKNQSCEDDFAIEEIIESIHAGLEVKITHIDVLRVVRASVRNESSWRNNIRYYAERPMTDVEIIEAEIRLNESEIIVTHN